MKLHTKPAHTRPVLMSSLPPSAYARALSDIGRAVSNVHLWSMLGWLEIKQRYRRSVIGPFWLTLSTGALLGGMGPLYGRLFGANIAEYFAFLSIGYVVWLLLSGLINDSCQAFIASEGLIKQTSLPLTVHVLRVVWKNVLIFGHNAVIIVIVLLVYGIPVAWGAVLSVLGLAAIIVNALWFGVLLALLSARFRDIPPIIGNVLQVLFFLTPVLWKPKMLGDHYTALLGLNPLYHFIEVVRAPLLGQGMPEGAWQVVGLTTVVGFAIMLAFFARFRARIAYWV